VPVDSGVRTMGESDESEAIVGIGFGIWIERKWWYGKTSQRYSYELVGNRG